MRYPCNLIKDILPLYHDRVCSVESSFAVEEHFTECEECKAYYKSMCESDMVEQMAYDKDKQLQDAKHIKGIKMKLKKREILLIIGAVILGTLLLLVGYFLIGGLVVGLLAWAYDSAEIEVYEDVAQYREFMGENAREEFVDKWGMDETIFPTEITDSMEVEDYIMVYYNPWDAQYLSFLEVNYNAEDYAKEAARLQAYESTEYQGYYGATGFDEDYTLLAMYADYYQGFVYALTDNEDTIIYVEIIFCNYFMDLEYTKYVPEEYFPLGFDATLDNPYEQEMMKDATF